MNQKIARQLRKFVKYKPSDDPVHKRKYAMVVCKKRVGKGKHITFARCGYMLANKGKRLQYHAAKKLYRRGLLPREII